MNGSTKDTVNDSDFDIQQTEFRKLKEQAQPGLGLGLKKFGLNNAIWGFCEGQNVLLGPTDKM